MTRPVERFWHRLALALGRTVHELKHTMTHAEFTSWMGYYTIEPWGSERDSLHTGILASTMANCHAPRKGKPFEPRDFMPCFDGKRPGSEVMTKEQILATKNRMKMFAQSRKGASGGT